MQISVSDPEKVGKEFVRCKINRPVQMLSGAGFGLNAFSDDKTGKYMNLSVFLNEN